MPRAGIIQTSRLLTLPQELLLAIFESLLLVNDLVIWSGTRQRWEVHRRAYLFTAPLLHFDLRFLRGCSAINNLAAPIFCSGNTFLARTRRTAQTLERKTRVTISPSCANMIRKLHLGSDASLTRSNWSDIARFLVTWPLLELLEIHASTSWLDRQRTTLRQFQDDESAIQELTHNFRVLLGLHDVRIPRKLTVQLQAEQQYLSADPQGQAARDLARIETIFRDAIDRARTLGKLHIR